MVDKMGHKMMDLGDLDEGSEVDPELLRVLVGAGGSTYFDATPSLRSQDQLFTDANNCEFGLAFDDDDDFFDAQDSIFQNGIPNGTSSSPSPSDASSSQQPQPQPQYQEYQPLPTAPTAATTTTTKTAATSSSPMSTTASIVAATESAFTASSPSPSTDSTSHHNNNNTFLYQQNSNPLPLTNSPDRKMIDDPLSVSPSVAMGSYGPMNGTGSVHSGFSDQSLPQSRSFPNLSSSVAMPMHSSSRYASHLPISPDLFAQHQAHQHQSRENHSFSHERSSSESNLIKPEIIRKRYLVNRGKHKPPTRSDTLARKAELARQSRKRKKLYYQDLEDKVKNLGVTIQDLQRKLARETQRAQVSTISKEEKDRQAQQEAIRKQLFEIVKKMPTDPSSSSTSSSSSSSSTSSTSSSVSSTGDCELDRMVLPLVEQFVNNSRRRQSRIDYHLNHVEDCITPGLQTKFVLWGLDQANDFYDAPDGLWDSLMQKELGLTSDQLARLRNRRGSIKHERIALAETRQLLNALRKKARNRLSNLHRQMDELKSILTPTQIAKFFVWVEENKWCMEMLDSLHQG